MNNTIQRIDRNSPMNTSLSVTVLSGGIHRETPTEERAMKIQDPLRKVPCTSSKQSVSTSCQSFLIVNSKTIVLDVNLNDVCGSFDKNFTRSMPATSNLEDPQGKTRKVFETMSNKDLDASREKQIYFIRPVSKRCQHQNNVGEKKSKESNSPGIQIKNKESELESIRKPRKKSETKSNEDLDASREKQFYFTRPVSKRCQHQNNVGKKKSKESNSPGIQIKNKESELETSKKVSIRSSGKCLVNRIQSNNKPNHSENESFRCKVCWKCFPTKRGVSRHADLHSLIGYACEVCGKMFNTRDNLGKHRRTVHARIMKLIKCPNCHKCYVNQRNLNVHLKKNPGHLNPSSDEL